MDRASKPRFVTKTAELFAAPPVPFLVDGLIPRQGITGLSAAPGLGKTFLGLQIARDVVCGDPLFGKFDTRQSSVLFVGQDCSGPQYAQQGRKVFGAELDLTQRRENDEGAYFVKPFEHIRWMIQHGLDLKRPMDVARLVNAVRSVPNIASSEEPIDWVEDWVEGADGEMRLEWVPIYEPAMGVGLIILDSWRDMHSANENDNGEMAVVLNHLRVIASTTDAAILLIHHHGHASQDNPGNRWRGASAQGGKLDAHLEIVGSPRRPDRRLKVRKARFVPTGDFSFEMVTTDDECRFRFLDFDKGGRPITSAWGDIEGLVQAREGQFSYQEIAEQLVSKRNIKLATAQSQASQILMRMWKQGRLNRHARGRYSWPIFGAKG